MSSCATCNWPMKKSQSKQPGYFDHVMLDSGAYSAWSRGKPIQLADYIAFVKEHRELFGTHVTLDVLPSGPERQRTEAAIEQGAKDSYRNHQKMKDAGLSPIPVFHQGENFKWLERMLSDGETYIGLSTRKDLLVFAGRQRQWLLKCYEVLRGTKVRTHGFGITNTSFLFEMPFFSTDSTTWSLQAGFGFLLVPFIEDGVIDVRKPVTKLTLTSIDRHVKFSRTHNFYDFLSPEQKRVVQEYIEGCGYTVTEVRYFPDVRRAMLVKHYKAVEEEINRERPFRLMFATMCNRNLCDSLYNAGARNVLLSYFELRGLKAKTFSTLFETGRLPALQSGKPVRFRDPFKTESYLNRRRRAILEKLGDLSGQKTDD